MKYMDFNSSCSVCCLANILERSDGGFAEVTTKQLASFLGLPFMLRYDKTHDSYLAGAANQGPKAWNPGLSMAGWRFEEKIKQKEEIPLFLKSHADSMIGLLSESEGKHALVFISFSDSLFVFLNPHREGDGKPDCLSLTESELAEKLPQTGSVGWMVKSQKANERLEPLFYEKTLECLSSYRNAIISFCVERRTASEIREKRDALFRPFAIDLLALSDLLENEKLVRLLKVFQGECLSLFKAGDCKPSEFLNLAGFKNACVLYAGLVKEHCHRGRNC